MPGPAGTFPDPRPHWDRASLLLMPGCLSGDRGWGQRKTFCSGRPPFLGGDDILVSHLLSAAFLAKGTNWPGPHNTTGL